MASRKRSGVLDSCLRSLRDIVDNDDSVRAHCLLDVEKSPWFRSSICRALEEAQIRCCCSFLWIVELAENVQDVLLCFSFWFSSSQKKKSYFVVVRFLIFELAEQIQGIFVVVFFWVFKLAEQITCYVVVVCCLIFELTQKMFEVVFCLFSLRFSWNLKVPTSIWGVWGGGVRAAWRSYLYIYIYILIIV